MSEQYKQLSPSSAPLPEESDVLALIKKVEQHLVFLEKKIDLLLSQSSGGGRPFNSRPFSRPSRAPFDRSRPSHEKQHGSGPREFGPRRPFNNKKEPGEGQRGGFGARKKPWVRRER
jgi:hypothetical protein